MAGNYQLKTTRIGLFLFVSLSALAIKAQSRKSDRQLDITVSPSVGFRVLGAFKVPPTFHGTQLTYRDSLRRVDRPGQSLNFGANYFMKKNSRQAFSIGVSYTTLTFRRVQDNMKIGDWVHPQVGYITGVIQASNLSVKYDFRYRYAEASMMWYKSAETYKNRKEVDIWYFLGVSPAILVRDRLHIFTEGFTMPNGKNKFNIKDKEVTGLAYNMFFQAGCRFDYYLYRNMHGLFQPRLRLPVLPSSQGTQTVWIPQVSIDLGLVFLLGKEQAEKEKRSSKEK